MKKEFISILFFFILTFLSCKKHPFENDDPKVIGHWYNVDNNENIDIYAANNFKFYHGTKKSDHGYLLKNDNDIWFSTQAYWIEDYDIKGKYVLNIHGDTMDVGYKDGSSKHSWIKE